MDKQSLKYRSGDAFLPAPIVKFLHQYILGDDKSLYYINLWHGMHFLSGVLFGFFSVYFKFTRPYFYYLIYHTVWEIWQVYIGMTILDLRGKIDMVNDTVFGLLGVYITVNLLESK